jgi:hypothetical protein
VPRASHPSRSRSERSAVAVSANGSLKLSRRLLWVSESA